MRRLAMTRVLRHAFAMLGAALLLAPMAPLHEALAQDEARPLPRFASLDSNEVNMRAGPGTDYRILWVYQRKGLPVEIIEEFDTWRRVRDRDGDVGWVQQGLLSGKRTALILDEPRTIRQEPAGGAKPVAILNPGVVARITECLDNDWCRLEIQGQRGWLRRDEFFGTYPEEAFESD